ncbi:hypothetical protein HGRIS_003372 [Hohenbuehelia grisea]|uniref:NAD(P)-binding protein n=1 Tax=Hohenbuehelia grisea TaxID=104357 RepID=A0ABR3JG50_9AGAR
MSSTPAPTIANSKCILVTGATSGIGRALSLKFKELPSQPQIIVTGWRQDQLNELASQGFEAVRIDFQKEKEQLKKNLHALVERYPDLDTVVLNAGIQHQFDFRSLRASVLIVRYCSRFCVHHLKYNPEVTEEMNLNYTSAVVAVVALMPHFQKLADQGRHCFIVGISSGLSMVPTAWVPNYAASKAAVHSFLLALRAQLADGSIHVIEVMPRLLSLSFTIRMVLRMLFPKRGCRWRSSPSSRLEAMLKGDDEIPVGMSAGVFKKFEEGKKQMAIQLMKNHEAGKSY